MEASEQTPNANSAKGQKMDISVSVDTGQIKDLISENERLKQELETFKAAQSTEETQNHKGSAGCVSLPESQARKEQIHQEKGYDSILEMCSDLKMNNDPRFDALLKKSLAGLKESNQTVCAEVSNKSLIADYLERQNARMRTQIFRSN